MKLSRGLAAVFAALAVSAIAFGVFRVRTVGVQPDGSILIPTGQTLTPAGSHIEVSDRPLGMVLSPDGRFLAVSTGSNFSQRSIHIIDTKANAITQSIPVGDSFVGVAFSSDGEMLYVGGGQNHDVKIFRKEGPGRFREDGVVAVPKAAPSGLSLSADDRTLYVALNQKHALAIIDTRTRSVREIEVGIYPYTTLLPPSGAKVYVSNWGGRRPGPHDTTDGVYPVVVDPRTGIAASGTVSVIDTRKQSVLKHIEVGLHPSAMATSPKGEFVYVANANSDTVSVIETKTDRVVRTISVRLFSKAPLGSAPNALAVSKDAKTLFVANAANNAIAVVDTGNSDNPVRGFIPTGWYPTAVALSKDGRRLYVASGYGFGSIAPAKDSGGGRSYRDRVGVISVLEVPSDERLAAFTRQVMMNNRAQQPPSVRPASDRHPIPMTPGGQTPIRHVFYIIKENRTYDQVFGDLPQGNGDPSLVHFGRHVTPNHHALAEKYVLLDNFYAPGDQSALGHRWCTQGYASDWVHKYGNARNDQNPMLFAPTDFLWDNAKANGVSVRSYGERGLNTIVPADATWTDIYSDWKNGARKVRITPRAVIVGLRDVYSGTYPAFETRVPDQYRADRFLEDFCKFEKDGNLPRLVVLLLSSDHTAGTRPGFPTPRAQVADNDLALGRVVEAISKSRYWKESAIFVTEDDAQSGLDHVDGHRTVGLVISPYARRGAVDSTFYTAINMYRTIEQILGLPPTNQFDLAAEPMFTCFTADADFSTYTTLASRIPLDEMNPPLAALKGLERRLAEASMKMDFSEPDAAPDELLDRVIWHSVKGFDIRYPRISARRSLRTK
jgi:YVTN family beta-propeller protein